MLIASLFDFFQLYFEMPTSFIVLGIYGKYEWGEISSTRVDEISLITS